MNEDILRRTAEIEARADAATPGPWYDSYLDDSYFMNCVAVTTKPVKNHPALPHDDDDGSIRESIVATTLLQAPIEKKERFVIVDVDGCGKFESTPGKWDEDAEFIAHAREDIPWLIEQLLLAHARVTILEKGISEIRTGFKDLRKSMGF